MTGTRPGADEQRVRAILRTRGVGPDAIPPKPTGRPRDWLDDILDSPAPKPAVPTAPPHPAVQPEAKQPTAKPAASKAKAKRKKKPSRDKAQHAPLTWETSPRQSLADAFDRIPPRIKWLAYHASAAYLGWTVGLVDWVSYVTAWIADTGLIGAQASLWYAAAGGTFLLHRRTRRWWFPVAWLAAVPASSVIVGVLLYAPNK
ncbi:hypothetical protein [Streptomyces sp. NPDC058812]|uniref:hypothetical protein n=1 Tax=unclassified Streptomyces TaxID=2593676 RepID=UPI0036BFA46B